MIMGSARFLGGFGLAFGLLSGCSSSSDGSSAATCTEVAACGGDVTGTWKVAADCYDDSQKAQLEEALKVCPAATASLSSLDSSGTVTFDGSAVKEDVTVAFKVATTVPTSCLNGVDCASLQTQIAAQNGITGAACHSTADGCSCTYSQSVSVKQESTYTTSGSTITETDASDGSTSTTAYCVAGNTLTAKDADGSITVLTR